MPLSSEQLATLRDAEKLFLRGEAPADAIDYDQYEHDLLEIVLHHPNAIDEHNVAADVFSNPEYRALYEALCEARDLMPVVSTAGILEALIRRGQAGLATILRTMRDPGATGSASFLVDRLIDRARADRIRSAMQDLIGTLSTMRPEEAAEKAITAITASLTGRKSSEQTLLADIMPRYLSELGERQAKARAGGVPMITTGLWELDDLMGPIMPGEMVAVAARPGCGKTALVLQIATQIARLRELGSTFFSLEMPASQLIDRLMASSDVAQLRQLSSGTLGDEALERAVQYGQVLAGYNMSIVSQALTPAAIHSKIRRDVARHGIRLAVIDYIGLMDGLGSDRNGARWEKVGEESRALKRLALELEIAVIMCVQLGRDADETEPSIAMLRDSGSIEQDSDRVLLLYPQGAWDQEGYRQIKCKVGKNRHGRTGEVALMFDGARMAFGEGGM